MHGILLHLYIMSERIGAYLIDKVEQYGFIHANDRHEWKYCSQLSCEYSSCTEFCFSWKKVCLVVMEVCNSDKDVVVWKCIICTFRFWPCFSHKFRINFQWIRIYFCGFQCYKLIKPIATFKDGWNQRNRITRTKLESRWRWIDNSGNYNGWIFRRYCIEMQSRKLFIKSLFFFTDFCHLFHLEMEIRRRCAAYWRVSTPWQQTKCKRF